MNITETNMASQFEGLPPQELCIYSMKVISKSGAVGEMWRELEPLRDPHYNQSQRPNTFLVTTVQIIDIRLTAVQIHAVIQASDFTCVFEIHVHDLCWGFSAKLFSDPAPS